MSKGSKSLFEVFGVKGPRGSSTTIWACLQNRGPPKLLSSSWLHFQRTPWVTSPRVRHRGRAWLQLEGRWPAVAADHCPGKALQCEVALGLIRGPVLRAHNFTLVSIKQHAIRAGKQTQRQMALSHGSKQPLSCKRGWRKLYACSNQKTSAWLHSD